MVKRPTGSGGEPSSPNCGASAGVKARQPHSFSSYRLDSYLCRPHARASGLKPQNIPRRLPEDSTVGDRPHHCGRGHVGKRVRWIDQRHQLLRNDHRWNAQHQTASGGSATVSYLALPFRRDGRPSHREFLRRHLLALRPQVIGYLDGDQKAVQGQTQAMGYVPPSPAWPGQPSARHRSRAGKPIPPTRTLGGTLATEVKGGELAFRWQCATASQIRSALHGAQQLMNHLCTGFSIAAGPRVAGH